MAVKNRIIAKVLIEDGVAVKYTQFHHNKRIVGDPVATVRTLEDARVDEFYFCFLGRVDTSLVREMTRPVFTPVGVAGSIDSMDTVRELITDCGVEKVVTRVDKIGWEIAAAFGVQAVAWPLDYHGDGVMPVVPEWAGEVIATSIDRDGMMGGCDVGVLRFLWERPVVIAGGVGKLSHVKDAMDAGASGVAVASMFSFSSRTPVQLRSYLLNNGVNVRAA